LGMGTLRQQHQGAREEGASPVSGHGVSLD
jgi:hypothetical protein